MLFCVNIIIEEVERMKIATILPTHYLGLESNNDYHLCLAHLMGDKEYARFFKEQSRKGRFVMMDNGVVETGVPMQMNELIDLAIQWDVWEVILPDAINDMDQTILRGAKGMFDYFRLRHKMNFDFHLAAVPQGDTKEEWVACVKEMLTWPIRTIGISRFVMKYYNSRLEALNAVPELIASDKQIHLLGCPGDPDEMFQIRCAFPGRIRGVDSGIAAMYTQEGMYMGDGQPKPIVELDFQGQGLDEDLLIRNVDFWRARCRGEV